MATLTSESPPPIIQSGRDVLEKYRTIRSVTLDLVQPLSAEEWRIQPVPEVSPPWWAMGHTTWFFAKNVLEPRGQFGAFDRDYEYALNSYYEIHGDRVPRQNRGLLSRPTNQQVIDYRRSVDERMYALLERERGPSLLALEFLVNIGLQHEQQHQELMVTEIKAIRSQNPVALRDPYARSTPDDQNDDPLALAWIAYRDGGLHDIGNRSGEWGWDIELPVHKRYIYPFFLANRLITNREFLEFIDDGGYENPLLWLSDGWAACRAGEWEAPLYWEKTDGRWQHWTLQGMKNTDTSEPVSHVSFYEADAFARWKGASESGFSGCRLPTEFEWEAAAQSQRRSPDGNFSERGTFHPQAVRAGAPGEFLQLFGDAWEWTSSHFEAYPGYRAYGGALEEYNGKFMNNQRVLRGGSCATPRDHIRASYRNFWAPETRFQFSGIRLARDLERGAI